MSTCATVQHAMNLMQLMRQNSANQVSRDISSSWYFTTFSKLYIRKALESHQLFRCEFNVRFNVPWTDANRAWSWVDTQWNVLHEEADRTKANIVGVFGVARIHEPRSAFYRQAWCSTANSTWMEWSRGNDWKLSCGWLRYSRQSNFHSSVWWLLLCKSSFPNDYFPKVSISTLPDLSC